MQLEEKELVRAGGQHRQYALAHEFQNFGCALVPDLVNVVEAFDVLAQPLEIFVRWLVTSSVDRLPVMAAAPAVVPIAASAANPSESVSLFRPAFQPVRFPRSPAVYRRLRERSAKNPYWARRQAAR
jgi:hypothetical protein